MLYFDFAGTVNGLASSQRTAQTSSSVASGTAARMAGRKSLVLR